MLGILPKHSDRKPVYSLQVLWFFLHLFPLFDVFVHSLYVGLMRLGAALTLDLLKTFSV